MPNFKPKICIMCNEEYQPTGGCSKTCEKCRPEYIKKKQHENHVKRYKRKGYTQKREQCSWWKGGIAVFRDMAFGEYGMEEKCNRCGSVNFLCVHHKDRNRYNNEKSNLEILCKSCHQKEHVIRDEKGRFKKQHRME